MPREVDQRKTRKALRRLRRVAEAAGDPAGGASLAQARDGAPPASLSDWERDFVAGVAERLETYGSAFRDPQKGDPSEALSQRQSEIVRALERKARGKPGSSLQRRSRLGNHKRPQEDARSGGGEEGDG